MIEAIIVAAIAGGGAVLAGIIWAWRRGQHAERDRQRMQSLDAHRRTTERMQDAPRYSDTDADAARDAMGLRPDDTR